MKLMRSTKEGSSCSDCGTKIQIGDPIAYFGPRMVFGLTCHENEKTRKHYANLLAQEGNTKVVEGPEGKKVTDEVKGPQPQEWVVRVGWREGLVTDQLQMKLAKWLLEGRFCGQLIGHLNLLEFRAPRNVGTAMTKLWAENLAKLWPEELGTAEAAPLYLEGGTVEPQRSTTAR